MTDDTQTPQEPEKAERQHIPPVANLLKYFTYKHLPPHLQLVSQPFCDLAEIMASQLPDNAEKTVALRKLLEAKDCAVRAVL